MDQFSGSRSVPSDDVPKYLAAVLRSYKALAEADERLATTIERVGLSTFSEHVEKYLATPYADLAATAKEARETAECSESLGPLGGQGMQGEQALSADGEDAAAEE
ncbi:MAG: hypothetical protein QGG42_17340 [Phycisphaerae bacterium]|jgi:sulfite reductase beta subunit-like hemoprotein|nr:hypothetical protein [Phycisphaerae bacterium]